MFENWQSDSIYRALTWPTKLALPWSLLRKRGSFFQENMVTILVIRFMDPSKIEPVDGEARS